MVPLLRPPTSAAEEAVHWTSSPTAEVSLCQFQMMVAAEEEAEEEGWKPLKNSAAVGIGFAVVRM